MIGSSENRISYNGNGIATEFAYTFKILEKSDIKVLHVAIDGTEELLTTDYYVDMEKSVVLYPGYAPGAEIPEQNRPPILPVGERLVIYREVPITQKSALDKHWPFNVIEDGLDKLTIICQQIWDRLQRSFYVSESTSTNFDTKVPVEAGKTFRVKDDGTGFEVTEDPGKVIDGAKALLKQTTEQAEFANEQAVNAQNAANEVKEIYNNGNLTPISDLLGGLGTKLKRWGSIFANKVFASDLPIVYNSVVEMKADTMLWEGMNTKTLGYYAPNDGGGANYLIRTKAESDVDDGGSLHELQNGLVAELLIDNGIVNVKQFGAKGDNTTDDSNAIKTCIEYARDNGLNVVVLAGTYLIANSIRVDNYFNFPNIIGCNRAIFHVIADVGLTIVQGSGTELFTKMSNIRFSGTGNNIGLQLESCCGYVVEGCFFNDFSVCIKFYNNSNGFTESNIIRNCNLRNYTKAGFEFFRDGTENSFHGNRIELCTMSTDTANAYHVYIGGNCFIYNVYFEINCWNNNTIFYRDSTPGETATTRFIGEIHLKIEGTPSYILYSETYYFFLHSGNIQGISFSYLKWHNVALMKSDSACVRPDSSYSVGDIKTRFVICEAQNGKVLFNFDIYPMDLYRVYVCINECGKKEYTKIIEAIYSRHRTNNIDFGLTNKQILANYFGGNHSTDIEINDKNLVFTCASSDTAKFDVCVYVEGLAGLDYPIVNYID